MKIVFSTTRYAMQLPDDFKGDSVDILTMLENSDLEEITAIYGWDIGKVMDIEDFDEVYQMLEDWDGISNPNNPERS